MSETAFEKQILSKLAIVEKKVDYIMEYIEDTKLTEEERKQLDESISKIKAGNTSDFVSWKSAKKELGM